MADASRYSIHTIREELNQAVLEHHKKGHKQLNVSVSGFSSRREDWNSRSLRNNGFPHNIDSNTDSARYEKYEGLIIDVPGYIEEFNLGNG